MLLQQHRRYNIRGRFGRQRQDRNIEGRAALHAPRGGAGRRNPISFSK